MNNEIEMGGIFNLPLKKSVNELVIIDSCNVIVGLSDDYAGEKARDCFIEAVNSHDRLVKENKKLREVVLYLARSRQHSEVDSHYRLDSLVSFAARTLSELDGEK